MQPDAPSALTPAAIDAAGVALLLGLTFPGQFETRRRRLEAKGFPKPLPMRPPRWSVAAIQRWLIERGASGHAPADAAPDRRVPAIVARLAAGERIGFAARRANGRPQ